MSKKQKSFFGIRSFSDLLVVAGVAHVEDSPKEVSGSSSANKKVIFDSADRNPNPQMASVKEFSSDAQAVSNKLMEQIPLPDGYKSYLAMMAKFKDLALPMDGKIQAAAQACDVDPTQLLNEIAQLVAKVANQARMAESATQKSAQQHARKSARDLQTARQQIQQLEKELTQLRAQESELQQRVGSYESELKQKLHDIKTAEHMLTTEFNAQIDNIKLAHKQ